MNHLGTFYTVVERTMSALAGVTRLPAERQSHPTIQATAFPAGGAEKCGSVLLNLGLSEPQVLINQYEQGTYTSSTVGTFRVLAVSGGRVSYFSRYQVNLRIPTQ